MKKNRILFGPDSVVADVVSEKLKASPPFTYALNSPVELPVSKASDSVPFVKAPALVKVGYPKPGGKNVRAPFKL